jgi:CPA2 family monovalent cation:H+ antiporter-2
VGHHIVDVLGYLGVPRLVVESEADRIEELRKQGISTLFGDPANSEVLNHARLEHARALVVSLPDEATAGLIVAAARELAPALTIIARATTQAGVGQLAGLGAQDVIHPELEGGLEIVRHTLLRLGFPLREVQRYADVVRRNEHYHVAINSDAEHDVLHQLMDAAQSLEIIWFHLHAGHPLIGATLSEANIRARTGASVVALWRDGAIHPNPKSQTRFQEGDRVGLIGDELQLTAAEEIFVQPARPGSPQPA